MSTALEIASKRRAELAARGELRQKDPLEKARENPKSMRLAVNAKCYDCMGRDYDPSVKWRIGNCECGDVCPLYPVRPYQRMHGTTMPVRLAKWLGADK